MKKLLIIIAIIDLTALCYGQQTEFVKDSIMDHYMKSGYASKHFRPNGKYDEKDTRKGFWKDYEVMNDFEYVSIKGEPTQIFGYFLLYGEGEFVDGKRVGKWKFYALEDKSFKRIFQKEQLFSDGKKEGAFKYFYPNGAVGVTGNYVSDKLEGEVKSYYDDGKLYGTRTYQNGLLEGRQIYLHPNGKTLLEHHFLNDTLNGPYHTYYENGKSEEVFTYNKGKEDGIYQYYYENGQLWIEKEYKNGLLLNVIGSYDSQGNPRDYGTIKNGNGTVNYYTEEGKVYNTQTFKDGVKIKEEEK